MPEPRIGGRIAAPVEARGNWTGATIKFNNQPAVNQDDCMSATVNLAYRIS